MNTKNITYSAVFSAIFVLLSIIAISTGIAYSLFLDIIVPIYVCIVFLKLDRKYAVFMSITSLMIVFFILGNVEKWSDTGKWHKWHQHNRKRNDNVYPAKLYKGNFTEGIWCTVPFVRKIHITLF